MDQAKECSNCQRVFRNERDVITFTNTWRICADNFFWFNCACGSTQILRNDEVPWFSPAKKDSNPSLLNHILNKRNFPRLPNSTLRLQSLLTDDRSSVSAIADAIKDDPVLAAGILLIANNSKISSRKIETLEHAVIYIGRDTVSLMALTIAVGQLEVTTQSFDSIAFWKEAFLIGSIAEALAPEFAPKVTLDQAYIAGCLCNIGKIVTAFFTPEIVDKITAYMSEKDKNWEHAERTMTMLSHTKLGGFGAAQWGFPRFVLACIENHHNLPKFGERNDGLSLEELVSFANQIAHLVRDELHRVDKDILNGYSAICRIQQDDIDTLKTSLTPLKSRANNLADELLGKRK